jgi:cytochrome c biogenesis protein CcdA
MKKINMISGLLLVYLVVMSVIGWPGKQQDPDYVQYFIIMGLTLAIIILLRFVQIRRLKFREKQNKEEE